MSKNFVVHLTVDELEKLIESAVSKAILQEEKPKKTYVYGLDGIAKLFNVSKPSAQRIKNSGIISPAIRQIGRKIIVDVDLALSLCQPKGGIK